MHQLAKAVTATIIFVALFFVLNLLFGETASLTGLAVSGLVFFVVFAAIQIMLGRPRPKHRGSA